MSVKSFRIGSEKNLKNDSIIYKNIEISLDSPKRIMLDMNGFSGFADVLLNNKPDGENEWLIDNNQRKELLDKLKKDTLQYGVVISSIQSKDVYSKETERLFSSRIELVDYIQSKLNLKDIETLAEEEKNNNVVRVAELDDLKKMWDESKHIGEFYEKLKTPPFVVTDNVLQEFEGFIKENGIDIYQSFLDGVQDISSMNEKEFDDQWSQFTEKNENENKQEEKNKLS